MMFIKVLFMPVCLFVLSGCMSANVALMPQEVPSELNSLTEGIQHVDFNQVSTTEPACEATWQWPSRFGDIQFQECERGTRYSVQLTDQVTASQIDLSTVSWSWHNCLDTQVQLRGSASEFITNLPHITTCRDQSYYLLLKYDDDQGNQFWDAVSFRPGIYHK